MISANSTKFIEIDEAIFDGEVAAARKEVAHKSGRIHGRERLARASVILIDHALRAEALGDLERVRHLIRRLKRNLYDTGWRVQRMALSGNVKAKQAVGFLHLHGILLSRDHEKSCTEFMLAAEKLAPAAWHSAQCLLDSLPSKAWAYMEQAASMGHAAAQEWMGRRCLGEFGAEEKNDPCARSYIEQSANQGRSSAKALLAYLLVKGQGGAIDVPRAIDLYKAASESGDANAQNNLGELYETGRGVSKDFSVALMWYERAAATGLGSAQFNAGRLWAVGAGGNKDIEKARALLTRAEGNGVLKARQILDWLDKERTQVSEKSDK